jgi:hypothetical protein
VRSSQHLAVIVPLVLRVAVSPLDNREQWFDPLP